MQFKSTIQEKNLYGNIEIYSPNMVFMFYCNQRKLDFYVRKDLAKQIGEKKFQLTFEPKGLGYANLEDGYTQIGHPTIRENRCVVTGVTHDLTRHHIVPSQFRKHLPDKYKCSFLLVVLVNAREHRRYTIAEQKFYNVLAEKYGVPKWEPQTESPNRKPNNIAYALITHSSAIPEDVQVNLRREFTELTGLEPNDTNLLAYNTKRPKNGHDGLFGAELVAKVTDYDEFERIWLNHFIETTNPRFLPEDLILRYNVKTPHDEYQTDF